MFVERSQLQLVQFGRFAVAADSQEHAEQLDGRRQFLQRFDMLLIEARQRLEVAAQVLIDPDAIGVGQAGPDSCACDRMQVVAVGTSLPTQHPRAFQFGKGSIEVRNRFVRRRAGMARLRGLVLIVAKPARSQLENISEGPERRVDLG
jgi:hypothetical protein